MGTSLTSWYQLLSLGMRVLLGSAVLFLQLAGCAAFAQAAQGTLARDALSLAWRTYLIPEYGTRVDYPAGIFSPSGPPGKGVGERFETEDGRAVLTIYSHENSAGDTPAAYVRKNLRVKSAALDYQRITGSFFAISLEGDGLIYYSRCNFSGPARRVAHCFDLVYPQDEKRAWDPVVTRISLSLQPKQ